MVDLFVHCPPCYTYDKIATIVGLMHEAQSEKLWGAGVKRRRNERKERNETVEERRRRAMRERIRE